MSKIKLLETDCLENGTRRFQSQLWVGGDAVDFIMESDGIMKALGYGNKGQNFYPFSCDYEIVSSKSDMAMQEL